MVEDRLGNSATAVRPSESFETQPPLVSPVSSGQAGLVIRELTGSDDRAWDQLVVSSPQGNVFQRSDWLQMLIETSHDGLALIRLGAFNAQNQLRGGWAIPCRERHGLHFSYGFDFFYCGPMLAPDLCSDAFREISERQRVMTELVRAVAALSDLVVVEAHPDFRDVRAILFERWVISPDYTHIWDLSDPDALLRSMNREKRREIRRASEKFRVGREEANLANLDAFMSLYRTAMSKFSWYPTPGWETILRRRICWMEEQDGCRFYTVRGGDGEILAALIVLLSREDGTGYYWRMGYNSSGRQAEVVPALYWQAALELSQSESPLYRIDLGGSPQLSLSQFKDYLGAAPTPHFRLIHRKASARLNLLQLYESGRDRARRLLGASSSLRYLYKFLQRGSVGAAWLVPALYF